ncbi:MAG: DUF3368 domain-containing protein, partial [Thermoplasmatota archaeon]
MLVFDATPLIYLAKAAELERLDALETEKVIPEAVYAEVVTTGKEKEVADAFVVEKCVETGVFSVEAARRGDVFAMLRGNRRLSEADVAVLAMAKQRGGTAILDDDYARSIAAVEGIDNRGTIFLIVRLLRRGTMTPGEAKKTVDTMIDCGWYCSIDLYKEIVNTIL